MKGEEGQLDKSKGTQEVASQGIFKFFRIYRFCECYKRPLNHDLLWVVFLFSLEFAMSMSRFCLFR